MPPHTLMTINCQPVFPPQDCDLVARSSRSSRSRRRPAPALARRATCTHLRGSLASLASQLTCIGLTIIKVSRTDLLLIA